MADKTYEVKIEEYEYEVDGQKLMAVLALPVSGSKFPVVVDIHGHVIGSEDSIKKFSPSLDRPYTGDIRIFTKKGFAVFLPVMIGYGRTGGKMDFCGPATIKGVVESIRQIVLNDERLNGEVLVAYGVSRGAIVSAQLATKFPKMFKAAIFQSGAYDAKNNFETTQIEGIRENFRKEAGTSERAFRERSSIFDMEKLQCPVLILHGENDDRIDVSEAKNLDKKLTELNKEHKSVIFPGMDHFLSRPDVSKEISEFLTKYVSN